MEEYKITMRYEYDEEVYLTIDYKKILELDNMSDDLFYIDKFVVTRYIENEFILDSDGDIIQNANPGDVFFIVENRYEEFFSDEDVEILENLRIMSNDRNRKNTIIRLNDFEGFLSYLDEWRAIKQL